MFGASVNSGAVIVAILRDEAYAAGNAFLVDMHVVEHGSKARLDRLRAAIEGSVWPAGWEWH